ncbi:hypothetical protein BAE44_0020911 [Dichanthelium oligosanthes]|uniref:Uncharacterized protein n=1 Tax=Dichanthelium oligosanthes TaxID=888268 RepID=A0A1E5UYV6_9POAL|nr:hypothetical protein BAE44_0020911 [Dichanthelium oligosanthes]
MSPSASIGVVLAYQVALRVAAAMKIGNVLSRFLSALLSPTSTPASRAMAIGATTMLLSVGAGVHSGAAGSVPLLSLTGFLAGANIVAVGVRVADVPALFARLAALPEFLRCHSPVVALAVCSFILTALIDETRRALYFTVLTLLQFGLLLNSWFSSWMG